MAKEIKNYLKSVKNITAPLNWKSSPDSPPTQLAYVTQPEIDMLVKANIHGSMNGKPNMGPKGIISLDGFGAYDSDSVVSKPKQKQYESAGGASQSSFDQPGAGSMVINNIDYGQAYQNEQNISGGTNNPVTNNQGQTVSFGITPEEAKKIKEEKEKKDKEQQVLDLLFGAEGDTSVKKSAFDKDIKKGKHPLRAQLDYLIAKYGDDVVNTEQGKLLMGYLAGVPVERGGGLGAQDENYGLTGDEAKEFQSKLLLDEDFMDAENYRQRVLNQFGGKLGTIGSDFVSSDFLKDLDIERLREGLSPEQYFNFRQQLMAVDPTAENQLYKSTFPGSSGAGLGAILEKVMPGSTAISAITGGILPERNMVGYQGTNDPFAATFKALPQSQKSSSGVMSTPAFTIGPGQDAPPKPGPGFTPDAPTGPSFTPQNTSPFDLSQFYAGLPNYSYGQQGVMSPNINPNLASYYENLKKYYGIG